jgi:hypothetical protein
MGQVTAKNGWDSVQVKDITRDPLRLKTNWFYDCENKASHREPKPCFSKGNVMNRALYMLLFLVVVPSRF